jgi:Ca2+-binding RTX toxin-like protein
LKRLLPSAAVLALVLVVCTPALGQRPVALVDCVIGGRCIGTNGHDTITASNRRDVIFARAGNDTVRARGGNDRIYGGPGRDRIFAGTGQDFINVRNDAFRDFVSCGSGFDTVNNMPGPGPADSFAGDCEEFVQ